MAFHQIRVAIADDHPIVTTGVKAVLSQATDKEFVGMAQSGKALLKLLSEKDVDVLLLDLNIPGDDYTQLIKTVRKHFPLLKIIAYTSYNLPSLVKDVLDLGVDGYILKDTPKAELFRAIESVFQNEPFIGKKVRLSQQAVMAKVRNDLLQDDFQKRLILSKREQEILVLITRGFTSQNIGKQLFISKYTVETHRKNILRKLNFGTSAELIKFAVKQGLV